MAESRRPGAATGKPKDKNMSVDWREHGVRIVRSHELDSNTPQTPGMTRAAAITHAQAGASQLWAGTVDIQPDAKTGAHHHGALESVIYVLSGRARMRWGEHLEFVAEAGAGDFIYVPPLCRTRRSMPARRNRCAASSFAATSRQWSSTWISRRPRPQRRSGSDPITRRLVEVAANHSKQSTRIWVSTPPRQLRPRGACWPDFNRSGPGQSGPSGHQQDA